MEKIAVFCLLLSLFLPALGCGSSTQQKNDTARANNPAIREFNQQLGEIKDQPSAEKAVNTFVGYVDSRLNKGATAQSLRALMTDYLVSAVARQELLTRQGKPVTDLSANDPQAVKPPIDIGTVTDKVNELGTSEGIRVDDETVQTVKTAVESAIPNLNPEGKAEMTPLNALVLGYAIGSGDDGSAKEDSLKIPADKMSAFVETVTQ
jgi:hypothetical protein